MKKILFATAIIAGQISNAVTLEDLRNKQLQASIAELDKKMAESTKAPAMQPPAFLSAPPVPSISPLQPDAAQMKKGEEKEAMPILVGIYGIGSELSAEWYYKKIIHVTRKGELVGRWKVIEIKPNRATVFHKKKTDVTVSSIFEETDLGIKAAPDVSNLVRGANGVSPMVLK